MTAVIRFADASFAALIMISSSMRFWSTGTHAGLDDEDVGAANRLLVATVRLAVRERLELIVAELDPELLGDPRRERPDATGPRTASAASAA